MPFNDRSANLVAKRGQLLGVFDMCLRDGDEHLPPAHDQHGPVVLHESADPGPVDVTARVELPFTRLVPSKPGSVKPHFALGSNDQSSSVEPRVEDREPPFECDQCPEGDQHNSPRVPKQPRDQPGYGDTRRGNRNDTPLLKLSRVANPVERDRKANGPIHVGESTGWRRWPVR